MGEGFVNKTEEMQASPDSDIQKTEEPGGFFTEADIRRNMKLVTLMVAIFTTGWSDMQIALQPLLVYLGATYKQIGFVQGAAFAGILGTILSPYITRKFVYKKMYFLAAAVPTALVVGIIGCALVAADAMGIDKHSLLMFVIGMMLFYYFLGGFGGLPQQEYAAACIPVQYRGRFTGLSVSIGSALSLGLVSLGGVILKIGHKPSSFGYCFLLSMLICLVGYSFAFFAKEKPTPVDKSPIPWSRDMFNITWRDKPFLRFLLAWAFCSFIFVSVWSLIPSYGFKELKMAAYTSAIIAALINVVRIAGATPVGFLVDKMGAKKIMPVSMIGAGIGYSLIYFVPNQIGLYASIATVAASYILFVTAGSVLVFSIPKPEHRAGHYSVQLLFGTLVYSVSPTLTGLVCDFVKFDKACLGAGIVALIGYPLVRWMLKSLSDDAKAYS